MPRLAEGPSWRRRRRLGLRRGCFGSLLGVVLESVEAGLVRLLGEVARRAGGSAGPGGEVSVVPRGAGVVAEGGPGLCEPTDGLERGRVPRPVDESVG